MRLEPYEGKLSSTVLRGGSGSNATALPDTLTLLVAGNRQVKVRLAGIDAPELAQPFGQKSKQSLSKLAARWEDRATTGGAVGIDSGQVRVCGALRGETHLPGNDLVRGGAVHLTQCGLSRLDGDKDGVPCEALCR